MLNSIYDEATEKMEQSLEALKRDYKRLRTGKVNTTVLDGVTIDYYGTQTPLNQVGSVTALDATTIAVNPWEKNLLQDIEKAIQAANIGVSPNNDGDFIKLFFPPMTIDQRKESAKGAKVMTDNAKVAIRNVRKHSNDKIKVLHKDKEISDDENKKALDEIQKITDSYVTKADTTLKAKEQEILTV